MSAIVNDLLNVSSLSQAAASSNNRLPVELPTAAGTSADLHASGLSSTNLYYRINSSGAFTLTLPANYSAYKGRVLHLVNGAANAVTTAAVSSTSGALYNTAGSATTTFLAAAVGNWATLVCDGSTGWFVVASNPVL